LRSNLQPKKKKQATTAACFSVAKSFIFLFVQQPPHFVMMSPRFALVTVPLRSSDVFSPERISTTRTHWLILLR